MKKLLLMLLIPILGSGLILNAQKITVIKGSAAVVKGQKMLATYDYSGMAVGKFDKEEDYISKKVDEYNKVEAGKGEKWLASWKGDRESRYEPKFEELFNKYGEKAKISAFRSISGAQYEINIHTVFLELGAFTGVGMKPAEVDAIVTIKEIESGKEVAVLRATGMAAKGYNPDTGVRVGESYAKFGRELAVFLTKQK
jgi:hypothetical protein